MQAQNLFYPLDYSSGKIVPEKERVLFLSYRESKVINKPAVKVISIYKNNSLYKPKESLLLINQIAEGDSRATNLLYRCYAKKIQKYIYIISGKQPQYPEDIVQDIFLKIWEIRKRLPMIESFDKYLFCMVKNHLTDASMKLATYKKTYLHLENTMAKYDDTTGNDVLFREVHKTFNECIKQLPPRTKQAFLLKEVYGLKNKNIAIEMRISESAAKQHLQIAKERIRTLMKEKYI